MRKEKPSAAPLPDAEFPEAQGQYALYERGFKVGHSEGRAEGVIEGRRQKISEERAPFTGVLLVGAVCGALGMWIVYGIARVIAAWFS